MRYPHLAPMEVCEQKFHAIPYFGLPTPSIICHKMRWQTVAPCRALSVFRVRSDAVQDCLGFAVETAVSTVQFRERNRLLEET